MDNTKGTTLNTYLYFFDDFVDDQQRIKTPKKNCRRKNKKSKNKSYPPQQLVDVGVVFQPSL